MSAELELAVIDRIEDGMFAVLIVGETEQQYVIPTVQLPEGAGEGMWLRVKFANDTLVEANIDVEATARAHARISEKMNRLRKRGRRL